MRSSANSQRLLLNLLLGGLSLCFSFLLLEAICQLWPGIVPLKHRYLAHRTYGNNVGDLCIFFNSERYTQNNYATQYDSLIGWVGKAKVSSMNWSIEQDYEVITNNEGFRDKDHEIDAAPGTIRIAILGDSFIWGQNLNQNELMPQLLETRLNQRGWRVEVFNFGIMGYGNDQELLLYRRYVKKYKPDIVALSFFYSNDFWNNYEELSSHKAKPYFQLDSNGTLHLLNVPVPRNDTLSRDRKSVV